MKIQEGESSITAWFDVTSYVEIIPESGKATPNHSIFFFLLSVILLSSQKPTIKCLFNVTTVRMHK
jgi:hypothetical protein